MDTLHSACERIQREVLVSMFDACPAATRDALGLHLEAIADVAVSVAEHDPSILLNRAQGLGSREPVALETIEAIVACYRRHRIGRYFLHVHPRLLPDNGREWLEAAGLVKTRGWMQFVRGNAPPPRARTDLRVTRVGPERAEDFARIACDAFDLTARSRPYIAAILDDDRWHCFMSFADDVPCGTGALLVLDDVAYLSFGATTPAYRRRGSQGALMVERIRTAIALGCRQLFTETGESVEGEEQTSYRNIERFGFEPKYLCENWTIGPQRG